MAIKTYRPTTQTLRYRTSVTTDDITSSKPHKALVEGKIRSGGRCRAPALRGNRRCRMHGGASTGPRTPEGLARSRRSRWKYGRYSSESRAEQKRVRELLQQTRDLLKQL